MKLAPWTTTLPSEAGKYAKQIPALKYPEIVDIVAGATGELFEVNASGKFWELRPGASWAKVEEL